MNELNISELKCICGGGVTIIGYFVNPFDALDAIYAFIEGFDEGFASTCDCTCES